jgi:hypothetical protein
MHLKEFFFSAQAIQINILYSSVATPNDINFAALVGNFGQIRILADQVLVMSPGTQQLTMAPIAGGFLSATNAGVTLATLVGTGCSIAVRMANPTATPNTTQVYLDITTGGVLTATVEVQWKYIDDTETFNNPSPTRVYPAPVAYDPAHKLGSASFTAVGT